MNLNLEILNGIIEDQTADHFQKFRKIFDKGRGV
jgi:hypothetical protein